MGGGGLCHNGIIIISRGKHTIRLHSQGNLMRIGEKKYMFIARMGRYCNISDNFLSFSFTLSLSQSIDFMYVCVCVFHNCQQFSGHINEPHQIAILSIRAGFISPLLIILISIHLHPSMSKVYL